MRLSLHQSARAVKRNLQRTRASLGKMLWKESSQEDAAFMRAALEEARKSLQEGNVPVGAVLVMEGKVIGRARNTANASQDRASHAEASLLTQCSQALRKKGNAHSSLYVTLEPCLMCL